MKVYCTLVGIEHDRVQRGIFWPEEWPLPREGDTVELKDGLTLAVRTVVWVPEGSDESDPEPYAYVVIGPRRPDGTAQ